MRHWPLILVVFAAAPLAAQEWIPFRWIAHDGTPRDLEYLRSAVVIERGFVRVELRRNRETLLAQDPSIAPETMPWTWAAVRLECAERRWQMTRSGAVDAEGHVNLSGASNKWMPIERATLPAALHERFCPTS
jgi:hypothetical protein